MSNRLNRQDFVERASKGQIDKRGYSKVKSEFQSGLEGELVKVSDEFFDFLNKRYPISMNLLRKVFGQED